MQDNEFEPWGADDPGPDYVSLVIEWDTEDDELARELVEEGLDAERLEASEPPELETAQGPLRKIAIVLGAIGALFAAGWGFRKLREA